MDEQDKDQEIQIESIEIEHLEGEIENPNLPAKTEFKLKIKPNDTLFTSELVLKERQKALESFFSGRTPPSEIRTRVGRSGTDVDYLNGYYMFRQASLITGFKWEHDLIYEKILPNESAPKEIITRVIVHIYDNNGQKYSQPGVGSKQVARYNHDDKKGNYKRGDIISLGDDMKAAETDAIKKALSYFGIGNDVYGHREKNLLDDTSEEKDPNSQSDEQLNERDGYKLYSAFLKKNHITFGKAKEIYLEVKGTDKIEDYIEAGKVIKEWYKKKEDRDLQ